MKVIQSLKFSKRACVELFVAITDEHRLWNRLLKTMAWCDVDPYTAYEYVYVSHYDDDRCNFTCSYTRIGLIRTERILIAHDFISNTHKHWILYVASYILYIIMFQSSCFKPRSLCHVYLLFSSWTFRPVSACRSRWVLNWIKFTLIGFVSHLRLIRSWFYAV